MTREESMEGCDVLVHAADLHLGRQQYGSIARFHDFIDQLNELRRVIEEVGAKTLLLSGDLFDMAKPPDVAVEALSDMAAYFRDMRVEVIAIHGNHDPVSGWMRLAGVRNAGSAENRRGIKIKSGLVVGGCGFYARPDMLVEELKSRAADGCKYDIFMMHQSVSGLGGSGYLKAEYLSELMADLGVRYLALGDIHTRCSRDINGVRMVYPGATERTSTSDGTPGVEAVYMSKKFLESSPVDILCRSQMTIQADKLGDDEAIKVYAKACETNRKKPIVILEWAKGVNDFQKIKDAMMAEGCVYVKSAAIIESSSDGIETKLERRTTAEGLLQSAMEAFFDEGSREISVLRTLLAAAPETRTEILGRVFQGLMVEPESVDGSLTLTPQ